MKRLRSLVSRVLDMPESEVNDATAPQNAPSWDSFNAMVMVSELEQTFSVKFSMDEVTAVKCVGDIRAALKRHGVQLND